jgi:hypothetical protein
MADRGGKKRSGYRDRKANHAISGALTGKEC